VRLDRKRGRERVGSLDDRNKGGIDGLSYGTWIDQMKMENERLNKDKMVTGRTGGYGGVEVRTVL
jgi:hypothetical protein